MELKKCKMAAMLLLALVTVGCNAPNTPPQASSSATHATKTFPLDSLPLASELGDAKDTLVVALPMDVKVLNPVLPGSNYDIALQMELFLPLVRYYSEKSKWEPVLADKLNWSEDKTKLVMTLKQGYTWSDGEPLTADDVKFTYDLMADPRVGSQQGFYRKNMVTGWDPKVIDDNTLEWHFQHAYDQHQMMLHLSAKLVPKHILAAKDPNTLAEDAFNQKPVTSGPWVVAEKQPNDHIKWIPNPNFHGSEIMQPRLKSVVFRIIPDAVTRTLELEQGSVDMIFGAAIEDVERWAGVHPELKAVLRKYTNVAYMAYGLVDQDDLRAKRTQLKNNEVLDWSSIKPHPIFGDIKVRRALAKAINVRAIIEQVWTSRTAGTAFADSAVSLVSPLFDGVTPKIAPMSYTVEEASQELAAAGWRDTNKNGILDKDSHEFAFTVLVPSNVPKTQQSALMMQSDLRKVGVDMRINNMEMNSMMARHYSGEYDAYLLGTFAEVDNMAATYWDPQYNGWASGYASLHIRDLLDQVWHEPDPAKSNALLQKVQEAYYADQPLFFLCWTHRPVVFHQRFHGMSAQDVASPLTDLHNWWVQPNEVKYH